MNDERLKGASPAGQAGGAGRDGNGSVRAILP